MDLDSTLEKASEELFKAIKKRNDRLKVLQREKFKHTMDHELSDYFVNPSHINDPKKVNKALKEWSYNKVLEVYSTIFKPRIQNNKVPVWRMIVASEDWVPGLDQYGNKKPLGKYWTWDQNAAFPYWGGKASGVRWLLHGLIDIDSIDWIETLVQNSDPEFELEKEVTLKSGSSIYLLWYRLRNRKTIDVNKMFEHSR